MIVTLNLSATSNLYIFLARYYVSCLQLFDLHLASARLSAGAQDGCISEQCSQCPGNSMCVGNLNGVAPQCTCLPGLRGAACDQCKYYCDDGKTLLYAVLRCLLCY